MKYKNTSQKQYRYEYHMYTAFFIQKYYFTLI